MLARSAEPPEDFDGVWIARPAATPPATRTTLYANLRALDDAERRRDPDRSGAATTRRGRRCAIASTRATHGEDDDRD